MESFEFRPLASRQINGFNIIVGEKPGHGMVYVTCALEVQEACADMDVSKYINMQINAEMATMMLNDIEVHLSRKLQTGFRFRVQG